MLRGKLESLIEEYTQRRCELVSDQMRNDMYCDATSTGGTKTEVVHFEYF